MRAAGLGKARDPERAFAESAQSALLPHASLCHPRFVRRTLAVTRPVGGGVRRGRGSGAAWLLGN